MSKTTNKFSPEVRARAVRMVLDHEVERPGSVRLNSSGAFPKCIPALVRLPSGLMAAR